MSWFGVCIHLLRRGSVANAHCNSIAGFDGFSKKKTCACPFVIAIAHDLVSSSISCFFYSPCWPRFRTYARPFPGTPAPSSRWTAHPAASGCSVSFGPSPPYLFACPTAPCLMHSRAPRYALPSTLLVSYTAPRFSHLRTTSSFHSPGTTRLCGFGRS